jgi:hypothetical protein
MGSFIFVFQCPILSEVTLQLLTQQDAFFEEDNKSTPIPVAPIWTVGRTPLTRDQPVARPLPNTNTE